MAISDELLRFVLYGRMRTTLQHDYSMQGLHFFVCFSICFLLFWFNIQVRRHSKTLILLTNVDQKSKKQSFRLPFVASRATKLMAIKNSVSSAISDSRSSTVKSFFAGLPPIRCV